MQVGSPQHGRRAALDSDVGGLFHIQAFHAASNVPGTCAQQKRSIRFFLKLKFVDNS